MMLRPRLRPLLLLPLLALGACRSSENARGSEVTRLIRETRYREARDLAEKLAAQEPSSAEYQRLLRNARVAVALDRGRAAVLAGDPETGLERFYEAHGVDPENPIVASWILKVREQLAEEWLNRAATFSGPEDLDQAEQAYETVLAYLPEQGTELGELMRTRANVGLSRVLFLKNYREGLSKSKFDEGIRAYRDFLLPQADYGFAQSLQFDQDNERAAARRSDVAKLLAENRLDQAAAFEEQGLYFAARSEYRLVLIVDPENTVAQAGLDRMDAETRAAQAIAKADMDIRRGDFESAQTLLDETEPLTEKQDDRVTQLGAEIEEARLKSLYQTARDLERDYRYVEGVAAYGRLLEEAPYYEDAVARKATLEEFIDMAAEFYEKALAAKDDSEAAEWLRQIEVLWPEYKDVPERLRALEERLDGGSSSSEGD